MYTICPIMLSITDKDHTILEELRRNSRQSIRDIASKTKLRPSTVHQRLQRMIKEGIIEQFTLKLNNKAVGENFIVFSLISTDAVLPPTFFKQKYIKEAFGVTGEYDLVLKMKFEDIESFNKAILTMREKYSLKKTVTMIGTATIKEEL